MTAMASHGKSGTQWQAMAAMASHGRNGSMNGYGNGKFPQHEGERYGWKGKVTHRIISSPLFTRSHPGDPLITPVHAVGGSLHGNPVQQQQQQPRAASRA